MKSLLLAAAALLAACSTTPRLTRSPALGDAEGEVKFRDTRDGRTGIILAVRHLQDPERLVPPAYTYVAWLKSDKEGPPQKAGVVRFDKDLNGELRTVTELRSFEFFVTAEPTSDVDAPTGQPLLWTQRND